VTELENEVLTCNTKSFGEAYHVCGAVIFRPGSLWKTIAGKPASRTLAASFIQKFSDVPEATNDCKSNAWKSTEIITDSFRLMAETSARQILRDAWLGYPLDEQPLRDLAQKRLSSLSGQKILIWNRDRKGAKLPYEGERDTSPRLRDQLIRLVKESRYIPVIVGHRIATPETSRERAACHLTELWNEPGISTHLEQLRFFEHIKNRYQVAGSIGNRSGGMDGPALLGMPTLYLEDPFTAKARRMEQWTRCMSNYKREWLDDSDNPDEYKKREALWLTKENEASVADWLKEVRKASYPSRALGTLQTGRGQQGL
jgi:hypothetical protein